MTDEQGGRSMLPLQPFGGGDEIADVGGKIGVCKIAFARAETGEVEP